MINHPLSDLLSQTKLLENIAEQHGTPTYVYSKRRLEEKSHNCEIIELNEIKNINEDIYALYPNVGENSDFINSNKLDNIKYLYRKLDQFSWKYCSKGFFNFKNYIPKIISTFN